MARGSPLRLILPAGLLAALRILGATLAYLAVLDTAFIIFYALGQTVVPESARGTFGLLGLGASEAAALTVVLLLWRHVDGRPIRELGLDTSQALRRWLRGAAVGALMMGFVVLVGYTLIDGASWELNPDLPRATIVLVGGLIGYCIQGPAEEVLCRGYILENARQQWGIAWGIGVSTLAFTLLHALNPAFGPLPFVNLLLFGSATAVYKLFVDDGQLWGVFAIHAVWNWLQQVVFGLPNSGIATTASDALVTVAPNTSLPDPFWGGGFGPEGTLFASLVLLALIGFGVRRAARPPGAVPRAG